MHAAALVAGLVLALLGAPGADASMVMRHVGASGEGGSTPSPLFMGTGNFQPNQSFVTDDGSHTFVVSRRQFCTPHWGMTAAKVFYQNWYVHAANSGNEETLPGNVATIDGALIEYPAATVAGTFLFSGSGSASLTNGGDIWSDTLTVSVPADSCGWLWTCRSTASAGVQVNGPTALTANGEGFAFSASNNCSIMTSLTVASLGPGTGSFSNGPSPGALVAQGWDGSAVPLLVGDSICNGANDAVYGARGKLGFLARGLDDNSTSQRLAFFNLCGSGTGATSDLASSGYLLRTHLVASAPNVPFTSIISAMGQNDDGLTHNQYTTKYLAYYALLASAFGNTLPIVQTTISADLGAPTDLFGWTNIAGQAPVWKCPSAPTTGSGTCGFNLDLSTQAGGGTVVYSALTHIVDLTSLELTNDSGACSGCSGGLDAFPVPGHSWTLHANTLINATSIIVDGTVAPVLSANLVVGVGSADVSCSGANCFGNVTAVVQDSSTEWTVTLGSKLAAAHTAGETVADNNTGDGDHFASLFYSCVAGVACSGGIVAAKQAGTFH